MPILGCWGSMGALGPMLETPRVLGVGRLVLGAAGVVVVGARVLGVLLEDVEAVLPVPGLL